jgi:hypothetical protein
MAVVKFPTEAEFKVSFETYALALGKVAYAWNYLHEQLAKLFVAVIMAENTPGTGLGIWYSLDSDRIQRTILRAAIESAGPVRWEGRPSAREDLLWLMDKANSLANHRNNAVHGPSTALVTEDGTEMVASFFSPHKIARTMVGKTLLVEFDYCERYAEVLSRFTQASAQALHVGQLPWPDRPMMPNRRPKTALLGAPLLDSPK